MQNVYTNFDSEKKRQKKTTIVKRIEHRTSDGKLISTTKSKSVYIGDDFDLLSVDDKNDNFNNEHKKIDKLDESFINKFSNKNESKFTNQISTPTEWMSQKMNDDDLSTRSNDSYLKDSQMICHYSKKLQLPNLQIIQKRINRFRRAYNVCELRTDDFLMHIAKEHSSHLVLNHQNKNLRLMNIWTGQKISEDIADEWNHEMNTYWNRNYFKRPDLTRMGIGFAIDNTLKLYVIIAVYE